MPLEDIYEKHQGLLCSAEKVRWPFHSQTFGEFRANAWHRLIAKILNDMDAKIYRVWLQTMEATAVGVEEADLQRLQEMLRKFTIEEEFCLSFRSDAFIKECTVHGLNFWLICARCSTYSWRTVQYVEQREKRENIRRPIETGSIALCSRTILLRGYLWLCLNAGGLLAVLQKNEALATESASSLFSSMYKHISDACRYRCRFFVSISIRMHERCIGSFLCLLFCVG